MSTTSERKTLEAQIASQARVGMTLYLDGRTLTCIGTTESPYGTRYIFDTGVSWTISNICSNIVKMQNEYKPWSIW